MTISPNSTPFEQRMQELDAITTSWIAGYEQGVAHGYAAHLKDLEAAATHRQAARVVARVMDAPERDPEQDRLSAQRRAANYSQPIMKAGAA